MVNSKSTFVIIAVFVDDLIVIGNDNLQIGHVKKLMEEQLALTDIIQ